ncbi:DUF411 domain-containing protein [Halomonas shantousis]
MKTGFAVTFATSFLLLGSAAIQAAVPDTARLYKNPSCGCCDEYARHLKAKGIDVDIIERRDLSDIKLDAGVPYGYGSCHTVMLGDYVIEGHVPFEAVEKLFETRLEVAGIALAGMPQGSPGMPGPQLAPFEIIRFDDQQASPFMTL